MFQPRIHTPRIGRLLAIALTLLMTACNLPGLPFQPKGQATPTQPGTAPSPATGEETAPPPRPTVDVASLPPTAPRLVAQRPFPGEELPLDGSIDLYFDQPMNRASVEKAIKLTPTLPYDLVWVDEATLRITPQSSQLERATRYTVTIEATASSAEGLTLEEPVSLEVQTVGFLEVGEVVPAPESVGVETNTVITVFFNRPVVPLGIAEDATNLPQPLRFSPDIPGQGKWVNTSIYQWIPEKPLMGGQTYQVTVEAGLTDQTGGLLAEAYTWQFTTLLPDIVSVTPGDGQLDVPLDETIQIEFNQPMDRGSVEEAFTLIDQRSGQRVNGRFEWDDEKRIMTFDPDSLLALGGMYQAELSQEAHSASGETTLIQPYSWVFETVMTPAVLETNPANGATDVSIWNGIGIVFSAPMDPKSLEGLLVVNPPLPEDAEPIYNEYDRTLNIGYRLEPSTRYTITLQPGAADPYGNTINQPYSFSFTTGPYPASVRLGVQGLYGLYNANAPVELFAITRNVSRLDLRLARLTLDEFGVLHRSYRELDEFNPSAEQLVRTWSIPTTGALNEQVFNRLLLTASDGSSLEPGIYLLIADAPDFEGDIRHFVIVATDNLTFKPSFNEALVWLTDLQTGQPVADVPITFYDDGFNRLAEGRTTRDGTAEVDWPRREDLWMQTVAIVDDGEHFALALSDWSEGLDPWEFGLYANFFFEDFKLYLYTDRPIYRPGQQVFFKGVLRDKNDVTYSLPRRTEVQVRITNAQGDQIYNERLPLNEMGTFNGSLELDEEAVLGYYFIEVALDEITATGQGFQVAEYSKPEFVVSLEAEKPEIVDGDRLNVTVDARFFFGGAVGDAEIAWTVLSEGYTFAYRGPGRYSFYDFNRDEFYTEGYVPGYGQVIADGEGRTDANGRFVISLPARLETSASSQRFTIEAVVRDVNGREVAGRTSVIVHKGQYYVGVRPESYIGAAGEPQLISLLVVDLNSQPVANREITAQIVERRWNSVLEEDEFGNVQYVWNVEDIPVGDPVRVSSDPQGRATLSFTPPRGGVYRIRVGVADDRGRVNYASEFIWVSSDEFVAWRLGNNDRIDLVADRDSYQPGNTAEILIPSPFQGSDVQALVTVERGSVLSHEVITLTSNSTVYRLPITGDLAPNVYVSVVIVKGVDQTNPAPDFKVGLVKLEVEPVEQTIKVTLTPDRDTVGPREQVTYRIEATDFKGNPVDAELSLALVDLATLTLVPPNTGPIVDAFYGDEGLGVRTAVPLIFLVERITDELIDKGKGGGGGGGEGFFEIRQEFEDTAYWSATIRTGPDGVAEVTVRLPDNLTTWRMDARAVTTGTLVGQAEVDVVATKPLLIGPTTPRFFIAGDEATLGAVVNNNTDRSIQALVVLQATGATINSRAEQTVEVPAQGRVEVSWPVVVDAEADWVDLIFSVQGGGLSDASKPTLGDPDHNQMLPVYRYEVPETVGTAGQLVEAGTRTEGIVLPPTYEVTQGQVQVQIDPSLAAGMLEGLTWLEHFPYECTEQTVSRFLPNALTLVALREFGLSDQTLETKLVAQINIGLQKLYAQQHVDGGWGWWVNSPSNPTVTAYVIQGLVAAQEAGVSVEQRVIDGGISYLLGTLQPLDNLDSPSARNRQAYVLYVLAKARQADVSRTVQLYEARQGLQSWARALLAQTLWMIDPQDRRVSNLQSDLVNSAILSATGAHWEEDQDDWWNWNTDTRSTAIILDTFARLWPENELAPNAVRWLMIARQGGHWETTQETAWALIGLTDWMVASDELDASYDWTVQLNGLTAAEGQANRQTVSESTRLTISIAELLADEVNRLAFSRGEGPGRLYYSAHLTAYLPVEQVEALSRGIIVSRRYLDESGQAVTRGRIGEVLTVELTIIAPNDLYYAVIEDFYPAGAEPVDTGLLTESVLGERPTLRPDDPLAEGWGWWWFSRTELRDERAVLFADYLPAGTYQYTYQIRLGLEGEYRVIPPVAREFYFPEVYGRGEGSLFTILPE